MKGVHFNATEDYCKHFKVWFAVNLLTKAECYFQFSSSNLIDFKEYIPIQHFVGSFRKFLFEHLVAMNVTIFSGPVLFKYLNIVIKKKITVIIEFIWKKLTQRFMELPI